MARNSRPTVLAASQAAEALGIDLYDLAWQLRRAAQEALGQASDRIRRGYALDVARARRLMWAAEACEKALVDEMEAEEEADRLDAEAASVAKGAE